MLAHKRVIKLNTAVNLKLQQAEVEGQQEMEMYIMTALSENLQMLDLIDSALKAFKSTYAELKTKNPSKKKQKRKEESKREEPEIQQNEEEP
jgi:hypothetical protein